MAIYLIPAQPSVTFLKTYNLSRYTVEVDEKMQNYIETVIYTIEPLSIIIAFLFNLLCILIMFAKEFKNKIYPNMQFKLFFKCILCSLNFYFRNTYCSFCTSAHYNTLVNHFFKIYLVKVTGLLLTFIIILIELSITYDRLCLLQNKTNSFTKKTIKSLVPIYLIISAILSSPELLKFRVQNKFDTVYERISTPLEKNLYLYSYSLVTLIGVVLSGPFYSVLIGRVIHKFNQFVKTKKLQRSSNTNVKGNKISTRLTKIVIMSGINYIIAFGCLSTFGIIRNIEIYMGIAYNPYTILIFRFCFFFQYLSMFINDMILITYDKNFKTVFIRFFCTRQH